MSLKAQRKSLLEKAQSILAKSDVTADDLRAVEEIKEQVEGINARLQAAGDFAKLAEEIGDDVEEPEPSAETGAKSLGDHFFKSVGAQFKSQRGNHFSISAPEYKAEDGTPITARSQTAVERVTDYVGNLVQAPRERLMLSDILGSYSISGNTVTYWEEPSIEGDFGFVAEGGLKPHLKGLEPVKHSESLTKIAGLWTVTDEMIEDEAYLVSAINNLLTYKLELAEEDAFLNGDGQGSNIRGLLNREGIQTLSQGSGEPLADTIFRAMTNVQAGSDLTADAIVINPVDWQTLRLAKDANDQYYGGGFFTGSYGNGGVPIQPSPWGIKPVVSPRIARGTALVGNFKLGAQQAHKGGLRVDATNSHNDDFAYNRTTFRLEKRALLMVPVPTAFVKVTLTGAGVVTDG